MAERRSQGIQAGSSREESPIETEEFSSHLSIAAPEAGEKLRELSIESACTKVHVKPVSEFSEFVTALEASRCRRVELKRNRSQAKKQNRARKKEDRQREADAEAAVRNSSRFSAGSRDDDSEVAGSSCSARGQRNSFQIIETGLPYRTNPQVPCTALDKIPAGISRDLERHRKLIEMERGFDFDSTSAHWEKRIAETKRAADMVVMARNISLPTLVTRSENVIDHNEKYQDKLGQPHLGGPKKMGLSRWECLNAAEARHFAHISVERQIWMGPEQRMYKEHRQQTEKELRKAKRRAQKLKHTIQKDSIQSIKPPVVLPPVVKYKRNPQVRCLKRAIRRRRRLLTRTTTAQTKQQEEIDQTFRLHGETNEIVLSQMVSPSADLIELEYLS